MSYCKISSVNKPIIISIISYIITFSPYAVSSDVEINFCGAISYGEKNVILIHSNLFMTLY